MANGGELHLPACPARPPGDWLRDEEPPSPRSSFSPPPPLCVGFPLLLVSPPASTTERRRGGGLGGVRGGCTAGGGERRESLLGIADREWGGRQAPREAAARARGLMCLGWAGKWRHENFVSVGCARRGGGGLGLPDRRTDRPPAGQRDRLPGGRAVSARDRLPGCALRGSPRVSPRCPEVAPPLLPAPPRWGCPAGPGPVVRRSRE
ncbi:uncharacterized protein LOC113952302 [Corapipo altera]|uniref:uncharacterized protein LOC113952302 n=1 Tax=Corapipo altera TaxID=415028 RepID=UPI000FD62238|nr:uncharacterized protein LOC113952302 [Corapipo altera]